MSKAHKVLWIVCGLILLDYDIYMIVNLADLCHNIHCIATQKAGLE